LLWSEPSTFIQPREGNFFDYCLPLVFYVVLQGYCQSHHFWMVGLAALSRYGFRGRFWCEEKTSDE